MKKNILLLFAFIFISQNISRAQMTGSFTFNVTFPQADYNENRDLYFYVPEDYDALQSYPLVVGFRGGPNSDAGQFRDQLQPLSDSLGAIILCPENAAHFWNEEGRTKLLFQYSLDTALALYNIDEEYIYLTGLSYGGRHAVIVSMDTDDGPIPNLRGVIPFAAGAEADLQPNYSDAGDFAPACICIGLNDSNNFISVANNLQNDLIANNVPSFLNEIPGVGHTVAFPTFAEEMMECFDFIESQYEVSSSEEIIFEETLRVYPNPANGILNLDFIGDRNKVEAIWVSDVSGKIIENISASQNQIDLTNYIGNKMVLITVKKEGEIETKRVVIN